MDGAATDRAIGVTRERRASTVFAFATTLQPKPSCPWLGKTSYRTIGRRGCRSGKRRCLLLAFLGSTRIVGRRESSPALTIVMVRRACVGLEN